MATDFFSAVGSRRTCRSAAARLVADSSQPGRRSVRLEIGEYEAGDGAGEDAEHGVSTPQVHADRYDYSDDLG